MEKDIELLEEMKQNCLTKRDYADPKAERKAQALENLIKGYRELEERNKILNESQEIKIKRIQELEKENQSYRDYMGEPPCYDNASYIKKSKIKEKIEKYKKLSDEFYEKFLETNKTDIDIHDAGISCDAKAQVLQELLEEK